MPYIGTKVLTTATFNPNVVKAEYAVRGALVLRSNQFADRLANGDKSLPFDKVIPCNIGNPQVLKQEPIEFHRQPEAQKLFPPDAIARAKFYIDNIVGGTGAYGHSKGSAVVREEVARFMQRRDGHPADPEDIYLTDGASPAVQNSLLSLIRDENDAIMAPIPQYPLYSAAIAISGGTLVGYYLDEDNTWGLDVDELARATVRAMAVINPGNPTGQCLSADSIRDIIKFCKKENILILADEVYQENVYAEGKILLFKKVLRDMGKEYDDVELISFHSTSKGFTGECGRRGGYMELDQFYKLMSVNLCSNIEGQLMRYAEQRDGTLGSLNRAVKLVKAFNELEGSRAMRRREPCTRSRMSRFQQGVEAAKEAGMAPDAFYCTKMLDDTGIVVVPGSGFGQKRAVDEVIEKTAKFHAKFMDKHRENVARTA
ncbi:Pyridoxal phosphate-dependent transferase [Phytophthora cactorum]|nr:Pyridoxal phosphate-dependent transferase [Phytophthora cactorum]